MTRGGGGMYSYEFLVGVCRSVPQILTLFQTKTRHFLHPFSDLACKIHNSFQALSLRIKLRMSSFILSRLI